jgi:hypothetical protein
MLSNIWGNIDIFISFCNNNLLIVFHIISQDSESVGQEDSQRVGWQKDEDSDGAWQEQHKDLEGLGQEHHEDLECSGQEHHGGFTVDEGGRVKGLL